MKIIEKTEHKQKIVFETDDGYEPNRIFSISDFRGQLTLDFSKITFPKYPISICVKDIRKLRTPLKPPFARIKIDTLKIANVKDLSSCLFENMEIENLTVENSDTTHYGTFSNCKIKNTNGLEPENQNFFHNCKICDQIEK